jgi:hypothetical protein
MPDMVHASGSGTVLTLLAMPEDRRDPGLPEAAREAVIAAITTESSGVRQSWSSCGSDCPARRPPGRYGPRRR